jgi:hypothetical protein
LPFTDTIAFLDQNDGDPVAVVERNLHLSQINIAIDYQITRTTVFSAQPPDEARGQAGDHNHRDD